MYAWQNLNRRHRRIGTNGQCTLPAVLESNKTAAEVSHYETQEHHEAVRQDIEGREVNYWQNMISSLIKSYLDKEGSIELAEVTENLKALKEAERTPTVHVKSTGGDTSKSRTLKREKKARELFSTFDADGSGFISKEEMRGILKDMCVPMSELQLDDLMENMDADGSGEVDFQEFWNWYSENAQAVKLGALGSTTRLFVSKLYNSMVGRRSQKEAARVIEAHALHEISKLKTKAFRRVRPPPFECSACGKPFTLEVQLKGHLVENDIQFTHTAKVANDMAAAQRFLPVAALMDSNIGKSEAASVLPHRSVTVSQERRKRLRRLMFSQSFIALEEQQHNGESSILSMYATTVGVASEKLAAYSISPMLEDPDDSRGSQLRRGQCVEGFDPSSRNAKIEAPRSWGGLLKVNSQSIKTHPNTDPRHAGNRSFESILQRLMMQQDTTLGSEQCSLWRMKPEEVMDGRAKVIFKLDGECKGPTLLFGEFNGWHGEIMPDRAIHTGKQNVGSELVKRLPPGIYQYFMEREGKRQVDYQLPVIPLVKDKGGVGNMLMVVWPPDKEATSGRQDRNFNHTSDNVSLDAIQIAGFQVKSLDLSLNDISSRGVEVLCEAISKSGTIVHLNLSQNGFGLAGSHSLGCALRICQRLVSLNLSETSLGDDGIVALSSGLLGHGSLSELNLSHTSIHLDGCVALSHALEKNLSLVSLDISRNILSSDSMRYLADALSKNDSLEILHLSFNPIGPIGFLELSRAVSKTESIKSLSLAGCQAMECHSYVGFFHFCSQLCFNRSIITLDLQRNNISDYGAKEREPRITKIIPILNPKRNTFQSHDRVSLNLTDRSILPSQELAHALQKQKALKNVILHDNPIPEEWLREESQVETGDYGFIPTITSSLQKNMKNEILETPRERREAKLKARNERKALREKKKDNTTTNTTMVVAAAAAAAPETETETALRRSALSGSITTTKARTAGNGRRDNGTFNHERFGYWTSRRVWRVIRCKNSSNYYNTNYKDFYAEDGITINAKEREKKHKMVNEEMADNASQAAVEKCKLDIIAGKDGWPEVCHNLSRHLTNMKHCGNWPPLLVPQSRKRDLIQCFKLKELYEKQNMIENEEYEELLQKMGSGNSWTDILQEVEKDLRCIIDRILHKENIDGIQLPSDILKQLADAREKAFQWARHIHIFASEGSNSIIRGSMLNANHKGNVIRRDVVCHAILYVENFVAWEEKSYQLCYNAFSVFDPMGTGLMVSQYVSHVLFLLHFPWEDEELVAELTSKLVDASCQPSSSLFFKEDKVRADAAKLLGIQNRGGLIRFSTFLEWYVNHTVNSNKNHKDNNTTTKVQSTGSSSHPKPTIKELNERMMTTTLLKEEGIRAVLSVVARESREYTASCLRNNTQLLRMCALCHEVSFSKNISKMKHEANDLFHQALDSMIYRYELMSSNIALSFRKITRFTFPDYYEVYPSIKKNNELQVYEDPDEDSRPVCVINEGVLFEGLERENEWMRINHSKHNSVWVRVRSHGSSKKAGHLLLKRMELPRDNPDSERKTRFGKKLYSAIRLRRTEISHDSEPLTVSHDNAIFHPRVKPLPDVGIPYTLCKDVPEKTCLKVRARPEADATVLGMIGHGSGIIAVAIAGDWLQVRFKDTRVAWMLRRYRTRTLLEPAEYYRLIHNTKSPFKLTPFNYPTP